MRGTYDKKSEAPRSDYKEPEAVRSLSSYVKKKYDYGHNLLTRGWNELNWNSVIDDMNMGRRMFNAFVDTGEDDVASNWRWRGTRSKARNKAIGMHANLTAGYLLPTFSAQNEDSEIDRGFSDFMTDLVEWMANDDNSNYKENFLSLVFAMETDPIVYLGAEFQKVYQTIKIKEEDGKYTKKEVLDEVLSGFKAPIYTADQILPANAHERNLQKHSCLIKRRWISFEEAEAAYYEHDNFDYVKAGHNVVYNEDDGLFYDIKDPEHENMVEEVTYLNRRDDSEVVYLGGVYVGKADVDHNPMRHRDNFGAPRYNVQQFGFYPIGSHFLFYKSMMATLRWDNMLYDAMTEIAMNRAILDAEMPLAVSGSDQIGSDVIYPNAVVAMKDANTKISPLLPPSNLNNIFNALNETADSISENSISETTQGQLPAASQKAYSVAQAASNAKTIIGGVAKQLALSVSKYGLLMADIAVNELSTAEVEEIVGDEVKMKYRKFVLNAAEVGGKTMSKSLMFDESLIGKEMTEDEVRTENLKLYEESEKKDAAIMRANPEMFAKMKFLSKADYREVFAQNDEQMQAILTALEAQMRNNPYVNQETLTREVFRAYFKSKGEKFVQKPQQPLMQDQSGLSEQFAQGVNSKRLSGAMVNAGVS